MPTPWDILTTPDLLATVRAWALTSVPPYPATAAQLRECAGLVAPVVPDEWVVTPYPDGLRVLTGSCVCHFASLFGLAADVEVYGIALLAGEDELMVTLTFPGYLIGPDHPKLTWPVELGIMDGRDA